MLDAARAIIRGGVLVGRNLDTTHSVGVSCKISPPEAQKKKKHTYMAETISNQVARVCLCHRLFWDKSIFVLLQKLFDPYFFFFFYCCNKISCVQECRKIPRKSLLRNKLFQCNFQTATASPVFLSSLACNT